MSKPTPPHLRTGQQPPARLGRPRDVHLTQRLKDHALLLLAERGLSGLNADVLAARAGAGKGGVYRRWDTMSDLIADALADHRFVPEPMPTSSLLDDLCSLTRPFAAPLTVAERAAAAVLGPARTDPVLAAALLLTIVEPLNAALARVLSTHAPPATQGHPSPRSAGADLGPGPVVGPTDHHRTRPHPRRARAAHRPNFATGPPPGHPLIRHDKRDQPAPRCGIESRPIRSNRARTPDAVPAPEYRRRQVDPR